MSNLRATVHVLPCLLHFKKLLIWYATITLSVINRPSLNALWNSPTTSPTTLLSLIAKVFETILYNTLQKEIGHMLVTIFGLFFLGINTITVSFKHGGIEQLVRIWRQAETTSTPPICQKCRKKVGLSTNLGICLDAWNKKHF